jgi:uracil-DNA glycosylase
MTVNGTTNVQLHPSWLQHLGAEFDKPYFAALKNFLIDERANNQVFPPGSLIFNAFNLTPFDNVKVVIIGQDPYHGVGQAHGLSFSVPTGVRKPPSLANIYKEISSDLGIPMSDTNGNLEAWAKQGVLLLNATLTVRAHTAGSHQNRGWENFTDTVIKTLSEEKTGLVFMLWGRFAQNKATLIDSNKHCILKAAHPSPFSAYNGFMGCKHFSQANNYLQQQGMAPIDWAIS